MFVVFALPLGYSDAQTSFEGVRILPRDFYSRKPDIVARDLLGKTLARRLDPEVLAGRIVETEAYFGLKDPASRAYQGRKVYNELMFLEPGRTFIYMVHANWLLNIIAHPKRGVGDCCTAEEPRRAIANQPSQGQDDRSDR